MFLSKYTKYFTLIVFSILCASRALPENAKISPGTFFDRPDLKRVANERGMSRADSDSAVFEQTSDAIEIDPGLIFLKGTLFKASVYQMDKLEKIEPKNGYRYKGAIFSPIYGFYSTNFYPKEYPESGVSQSDQYVLFEKLGNRKIKALKDSIVNFERSIVLAEDTAFDLVNLSTSQITHKSITAKRGTRVTFYASFKGASFVDSLTTALPYDFGDFTAPANSFLTFESDGRLQTVLSPIPWKSNGFNIPTWTLVRMITSPDLQNSYMAKKPIPSEKLDPSQYKNYYCDKDKEPEKASAEDRGLFLNGYCRLVLTADVAYDNIPLKRGCIVYLRANSADLKGFNCPASYEFAGITFDKNSPIFFGTNYSIHDTDARATKACVSGKNLKMFSGHFFDGLCVSFDEKRQPEYIWSYNNVVLEKITYFGPVLFKISEGKLVFDSSDLEKNAKVLDFTAAQDSPFIFCTSGEEIPVYYDETLKDSDFSLEACDQSTPLIEETLQRVYKVVEKKKDVWKIERLYPKILKEYELSGSGNENNRPRHYDVTTYWIKETKSLKTAVTLKIGNTELMSPFSVTPNEDKVSQRARFADEDFIYFQTNIPIDCRTDEIETYKIPKPKNLKIEDQPAILVPNYDVQADICTT